MNNDFFNPLRPNSFSEFVGQKQVIDNLKVYIKAAKIKDTSLDHTLLVGHAGTGKTSLAYIIAKELNQKIIVVNANSIEKPKDIIIALSKLNEGNILFIDEIHALNKSVEEVLYSAMEDFYINLNVKNDTKKDILRYELPPFTLIGATTKVEDLSKPLLDRFSITFNLVRYTYEDISKILYNLSKRLNYSYTNDALDKISSVSRLIPRIAINYLKRINDYALIDNIKVIDKTFVINVLDKLGINKYGLNSLDIRYLKMLHYDYKDKPVGINTITSFLNESVKVVEDMIEKYLIELAFIRKTSKGRIITPKGITYLNSIYK
ncbi:MAG: Holliday junction branch migration DNA helicase RuvB [Bacilli bacterium]|nr:Holliday junction branch migration DNA helicase RuvB [Bacilli bacterium]